MVSDRREVENLGYVEIKIWAHVKDLFLIEVSFISLAITALPVDGLTEKTLLTTVPNG